MRAIITLGVEVDDITWGAELRESVEDPTNIVLEDIALIGKEYQVDVIEVEVIE